MLYFAPAQLEPHGIRILSWKDLTDRQRLESTKFFRQNVLPALTPLVVDSAHPTPFLSNLSLSWGCRLREPGSDATLYGRVKVATGLTPWIRVREDSPEGSRWFISLTELVRQHLNDLFAVSKPMITRCSVSLATPRSSGRVIPAKVSARSWPSESGFAATSPRYASSSAPIQTQRSGKSCCPFGTHRARSL